MSADDLVWMSPDDLIPWPQNPRVNDHVVAEVADSIRRFGFADPIVVRSENSEIISGHTRHKAALALGLDSVPVRRLDVDDARAHELAIASNKLGEKAEWDALMLGVLSDSIDLGSVGFDGFELEGLVKATLDDPAADDSDGWGTMRADAKAPTVRSVVVSVYLDVGDADAFERLIESRADFGEARGSVVMRALEAIPVAD